MTMTKFEPVYIGLSPAGVEWYAYKPERVEPMRARLAALHAKAAAKKASCDADLDQLRRKYKAARARVMKLKGLANRQGSHRTGSTWDYPGYAEASERLQEARKALRRAERKCAK